LYYLIYIRGDSLKMVENEGASSWHEPILRMLQMYIEPKWENKCWPWPRTSTRWRCKWPVEDVGDIDEYGPPRRGHDKD